MKMTGHDEHSEKFYAKKTTAVAKSNERINFSLETTIEFESARGRAKQQKIFIIENFIFPIIS
jgi:hypothetical protein